MDFLHAEHAVSYHQGKEAVQEIQIFGERCSGTNYLSGLLGANFPDYPLTYRYGWKHFPCWYDTDWVPPQEQDLYYQELIEHQGCLFIVIVRNLLDWLKSFYQTPYHVSSKVDLSSFSTFIRSPWYIEEGCLLDANPSGGEFENILQLRAARLKNLLKIQSKVDHYYFLRYESLRDHPEEVIFELARCFDLRSPDSFQPFTKHVKGSTGVLPYDFSPSDYFPIAEEDRTYIFEHCDLELEHFFGYFP